MGLRFINPGATWLRRASRQSSNATSCTLRCWAIAPSCTKAMPLVLTRRGWRRCALPPASSRSTISPAPLALNRLLGTRRQDQPRRSIPIRGTSP